MKKCYKCGETKARSEFHTNPTRKDGLQSMCKDCRKVYHRQHYLDNKEKYKSGARRNKKKNRDFIRAIKESSKCSICGDSRWYVLDFHHLGDKDENIGVMAHRGASKKTIMKEIVKCKVLCSNCHRELHYNERQI